MTPGERVVRTLRSERWSDEFPGSQFEHSLCGCMGLTGPTEMIAERKKKKKMPHQKNPKLNEG